jgi:hypothetical protein
MYHLGVAPLALGDCGEDLGVFKSKNHAVAAMMLDSAVLPYRAIMDSIQEDLAPVSAEGLTVAKLRAAYGVSPLKERSPNLWLDFKRPEPLRLQ